jgi:2-phospho-L-lactate guanylyltransferase
MQVIVPFDTQNPKTRLSGVLDSRERKRFARSMLRDVLDAIKVAGHAPVVLTTAALDIDAKTRLDKRPLTPAVNAVLDDTAVSAPIAVVMADLALVTPATLRKLFDADDDLVLARGVGGGTNALVSHHPNFRVDYHGASYRDHLTAADAVGASVTEIDSYRLGIDIDEPDDIVELLLHSDGHAAQWLQNVGIRIVDDRERVSVGRGSTSLTRLSESNAADN